MIPDQHLHDDNVIHHREHCFFVGRVCPCLIPGIISRRFRSRTKWEGLTVGTVSSFKMQNVGTVPTFEMHNIGTVPTFKMHNIGTVPTYNLMEDHRRPEGDL